MAMDKHKVRFYRVVNIELFLSLNIIVKTVFMSEFDWA